MENGWGKERKMNGKLAMLTLVASGERGGLKQNLWQMDHFLNYIYSSNLSVNCTRYSHRPGCK
jgi:hypothetical protein